MNNFDQILLFPSDYCPIKTVLYQWSPISIYDIIRVFFFCYGSKERKKYLKTSWSTKTFVFFMYMYVQFDLFNCDQPFALRGSSFYLNLHSA